MEIGSDLLNLSEVLDKSPYMNLNIISNWVYLSIMTFKDLKFLLKS